MRSILMQDWLTVRGVAGVGNVTQTKSDWLDLRGYADVVLWIEFSEMTIAGNLQLTFETAPADQESLFKAIDTITLTAASSTPIVRKIYMNAADGVSTPTLARFLRWKLSSPGGGTWDATFRIHVSVSESVRDAFLPLNLPNLLLWLRADLGVTTSGAFVTNWNDQSGNGNHVAQPTPANRPRTTGNIGGRPAIDFTTGSQFLENTTSNVVPSGGAAYSVLVVAKNGNGSLLSLRRSTPFSTTRFQLSNTYVYTDGVSANADITVSNTLPETQSATNAFNSCHRYLGSGLNPEIYLNGTNRPITSLGTFQTTASGSTGFYVGRNSVADFWNGEIAEIIVVGGAISDDDRRRVENYQRQFFGV